MEVKRLSNVIKPKFYKKYLMALSFILILNMVQIFGPVIVRNDVDPVIIGAQLVTIALMALIFTNYFYKVIKLEEDYIVYKGLTFTKSIRCKDVKKIHFDSKLEGKRPVYNIVLEGKTALTIKDAQNYKKEELINVFDYIRSNSKISTREIDLILEKI